MKIKIEGKDFEVEHNGEGLVGFISDEKIDFTKGTFEAEIEGEVYKVEPVEAYSDDGKYHFSFAEVTEERS